MNKLELKKAAILLASTDGIAGLFVSARGALDGTKARLPAKNAFQKRLLLRF